MTLHTASKDLMSDQIFVFEDQDYEKTLELVDSSTQYGLTGSM